MSMDEELSVLLDRHEAFGRVRYGQIEPGAPLGPGALAAENLQEKVLTALARGDDERRERLLARMAELPVEPQLEVRPAVWIAHHMLFMHITDDLEDCGEGDESWLEPVLRVLEAASPFGRRILAGVLAPILQDYNVTARERRRVGAALESAGAQPWDPYELSTDEQDLLVRSAIAREGADLVLAYRLARRSA
jgi:hypothetical protein